jgi:hypothetical protein
MFLVIEILIGLSEQVKRKREVKKDGIEKSRDWLFAVISCT